MKLIAVLNNNIIGELSSDKQGNPQFDYTEQWKNNPHAVPLSLSLPITSEQHDSDTVSAVIWGLLPDNENTLQRWGSTYKVSPRNPFALLSYVGEDCAGAVAFVREENLDSWLSGARNGIEAIDEHYIAKLLHDLRINKGTKPITKEGLFSLAGAQAKTALSFINGQWGIPRGMTPTTHILKPPSGDYDGYAENEHFCLRLSSAIGFETATSFVYRFEEEIAICVERYDRAVDPQNGNIIRVHQEDCCQALGVDPRCKYQNEGGPSPQDIVRLLRSHSKKPQEDVNVFFMALVFNWLIGGTDAHAKNYSLLLGEQGNVELAPLYDLSSILPYPEIDRRKVKMSMKIGENYFWHKISIKDWLRLGKDIGLERDYVVYVLSNMMMYLPDIASTLARELNDEGVRHTVIDSLVDEIAKTSVKKIKILLAGVANEE